MARSKQRVDDDLIEMVRSIRLNPSSDTAEKLLSETYLREVIQFFTDKLSSYLKYKPDQEVVGWLHSKLASPNEYDKLSFTAPLIDAKTLKTILIDKEASMGSIKILRAFKRAYDYDKQLDSGIRRIEGAYNQINVHTHKHEHLQVSYVYIDGDNSFIDYKSRRFTDEHHPLQVDMIGANRVLMTMRWGDCILNFYANVGSSGSPKFFEAVFIYNNDKGEAIGGRAIFEKVDTAHYIPRPVGRHYNELPPITEKESGRPISFPYEKLMVRYLRHKSGFIIPELYGQRPFDYSQADINGFKPGPYQTMAKHYESPHRQVRGLYDLYFTERFPSVKDFERKHYSTVAKAVLWIYADENKGGVLCCKLKVKKNENNAELQYSGYVINQDLTSSSHLILSMYLEPEKSRQIGLSLNLMNDKVFIGCHHYMYSPIAKIGAGVAIVVRKSGLSFDHEPDTIDRFKEEQELFKGFSPSVINPYTRDWDSEEINKIDFLKENQIVNFLSKREKGLVTAPTMEQLSDVELSPYAGAYKIYAYGKGGANISILNLYENGFAEHFGTSNGRPTRALGKLRTVKNILNIEFRDRESDRIGYFIIKVGELKPIAGETIYQGVFAGVSRQQGGLPLASQNYLEYISKKTINEEMDMYLKNKPCVVLKGSNEFSKLPIKVQTMVASKSHSFIGPLHPELAQEEETIPSSSMSDIDMGRNWFERAVYQFLKGDIATAGKYIQYACDIDSSQDWRQLFNAEIKEI